jgi:hypothetical protein
MNFELASQRRSVAASQRRRQRSANSQFSVLNSQLSSHSNAFAANAARGFVGADFRTKPKRPNNEVQSALISAESPSGSDGVLNAFNFVIGEGFEEAVAFSRRKPTVVLQTGLDEKIDVKVGHVDDLLDRGLGSVELVQKGQFFDELCVDCVLDESKKGLCLRRQINVAVEPGHLVLDDHIAVAIERVLHKAHQGSRKRFE